MGFYFIFSERSHTASECIVWCLNLGVGTFAGSESFRQFYFSQLRHHFHLSRSKNVRFSHFKTRSLVNGSSRQAPPPLAPFMQMMNAGSMCALLLVRLFKLFLFVCVYDERPHFAQQHLEHTSSACVEKTVSLVGGMKHSRTRVGQRLSWMRR